MATSASERRNQVMVGDLPLDFLRLEASAVQQQVLADQHTAAMLQAQQGGMSFLQGGGMPRLSITLVEAKLTKNYGLTKMDPYCRIRVGHSVFETQTATNGSKNPRWNKTVYCCLPPGVDNIYVEIFDERAFTMDDRVAWAHITISPAVRNGETVDSWYPLSGKQGEEREGTVNLILSYTESAPQQQSVVYANHTPYALGAQYAQPMVIVPGGMPAYYPPVQVGGAAVTVQNPSVPGQLMPGQPMPGQPMPGQPMPGQPMPGQPMPQQIPHIPGGQMGNEQMPQPMAGQQIPPPMAGQQIPPHMQPPQPPGPLFTDDDVKQVKEMFPNVEEDVIKSLFEANRGNKDTTINNLLSMSS